VATVRCNWLVLRVALRLNPYAGGSRGDPFFFHIYIYFRFPSPRCIGRAYIAVGLFRRSSAERACGHLRRRRAPLRRRTPPPRPGLPEIGYTHTLVAKTLLLLDIRSAAAVCISLKTTTLIAHRSRETRRAERKCEHRPSAIKTVDRTRITVETIHYYLYIYIYTHTHIKYND